jgi:hypothetical protein
MTKHSHDSSNFGADGVVRSARHARVERRLRGRHQ